MSGTAPLLLLALALAVASPSAGASEPPARWDDSGAPRQRPVSLVENMRDGPLKDALSQCRDGAFYRTRFSIGHRGAPLHYPEHTRESYEAAARQGAGIVECDVTFTQDR